MGQLVNSLTLKFLVGRDIVDDHKATVMRIKHTHVAGMAYIYMRWLVMLD